MPSSGNSIPTKDELDACRRCPLGERATQGVPGEGPRRSRLMLIGEQPGDEEDRQGKPFVGPAGRLLRQALEEAGIAAGDVYITNAVKHFSWEPRGTRRIHKTPAQREIAACHDWLEAEIAAERPAAIVALGATALRAVMGRKITVAEARASSLRHAGGAQVLATYHPSAVLRAPDKEAQAELHRTLVDDLRRADRAARGG
jgi:DNA polymerase